MPRVTKKLDAGSFQLKDQVVSINRVTKVVKGGKNMSFAALVVVGDPSAAVVGFGSGKAKEVPQAIRKGIEAAKKNLMRINLTQTSVPHTVLGRFGSGMVLLKPAPEGTGVICGRSGAGGDDVGGHPECADQVDWHKQSAQRDQGNVRGAEEAQEPGTRGGAARQIGRGTVNDNEDSEIGGERQDPVEVGAVDDLHSGKT